MIAGLASSCKATWVFRCSDLFLNSHLPEFHSITFQEMISAEPKSCIRFCERSKIQA